MIVLNVKIKNYHQPSFLIISVNIPKTGGGGYWPQTPIQEYQLHKTASCLALNNFACIKRVSK